MTGLNDTELLLPSSIDGFVHLGVTSVNIFENIFSLIISYVYHHFWDIYIHHLSQ